MESDGEEQNRLSLARMNGVVVYNKRGDIIAAASSMGWRRRLSLLHLINTKKQLWGTWPNLSKIACEHKVHRLFVLKIEAELNTMMGMLFLRRMLCWMWPAGGLLDQGPRH